MAMKYKIKSFKRADKSEHTVFTDMTMKQQQQAMEMLLKHRDPNEGLEYITETYFEPTVNSEA